MTTQGLNPEVDNYLADGCGRCSFGGTPQCKVHSWEDELKELRRILHSCMLTEERKWGVPCYTYAKKNILIMAAFKEYCSISFFKGALLADPDSQLTAPGENSQAVRMMRFTTVSEILEKEDILKAFIFEAVEIEKAGKKVEFKKETEPVPVEFRDKLNEMPALKAAFDDLTPGRQRGYILYFSQPKQSKTRISRIEKFIPKILGGKGISD